MHWYRGSSSLTGEVYMDGGVLEMVRRTEAGARALVAVVVIGPAALLAFPLERRRRRRQPFSKPYTYGVFFGLCGIMLGFIGIVLIVLGGGVLYNVAVG